MASRVSYLPFYRAAFALYTARERGVGEAAEQLYHVAAIDAAAELAGLARAAVMVEQRLGEIAVMRRVAA